MGKKTDIFILSNENGCIDKIKAIGISEKIDPKVILNNFIESEFEKFIQKNRLAKLCYQLTKITVSLSVRKIRESGIIISSNEIYDLRNYYTNTNVSEEKIQRLFKIFNI